MKEKTYYDEVMRYVSNAKKDLTVTTIEDGFYVDEKYVKSAGGIAYAGLEKAARWYLRLNDYKGSLKNNYDIITALGKFNYKAQKLFNDGYAILHKEAYYGDVTRVATIKDGLNIVKDFALFLKPYNGTAIDRIK
jgi:hypothetical protein